MRYFLETIGLSSSAGTNEIDSKNVASVLMIVLLAVSTFLTNTYRERYLAYLCIVSWSRSCAKNFYALFSYHDRE